ncbi:MAG: histone H1 [Xanthobacteraceae bacterium]|nr:histone H1 [Xanthobacteraceae bacterium]MBX3548218.1 histone H1 [Xanthobacteraceae bacterium]MCW5675805.1 histone H1 [Xanthobacteraceae bacterium]MCW5679147.1 histone H1 [Xanthobacteraceae bacterium]
MPKRSSKLPTDPNQRAKAIIDAATGEPDSRSVPDKNPAAVALGRLGGLKGGKSRAAKLSPEKRKEIAEKAAAARWKK